MIVLQKPNFVEMNDKILKKLFNIKDEDTLTDFIETSKKEEKKSKGKKDVKKSSTKKKSTKKELRVVFRRINNG